MKREPPRLYVVFTLRTFNKGNPPSHYVKSFDVDKLRANRLFLRLRTGIILGRCYISDVASMWMIPKAETTRA